MYCKIRNIIIVGILVIRMSLYAQPPEKYVYHIEIADSLFAIKKYKNAANEYSKGFMENRGKAYPEDRYNAVCCWAETGVFDSAFYQLNALLLRNKFDDTEKIKKEKHFIPLHADKRWKSILKLLSTIEEQLNVPIKHVLDSILVEDQKYRQMMDSIRIRFGTESNEYTNIWRSTQKADSSNLVMVKQILKKYGWLGRDKVGESGNSALFLVIQHSDLRTQQEYIPMMKDAVLKGNAEGSELALLIDRIEMQNGRKQIYGSQMVQNFDGTFRIYPIIDEKNVNSRRAEMGLGKLEDYVRYYGIEYKLPTE